MRLPALAFAGVLALASLNASLTACGSSEGSGLVKPADMKPALLTVENLSNDFEIDKDQSGGGGGPDWGCLFDLGPLNKSGDKGGERGAADDLQISFRATQEPGMPGVIQLVDAAPSLAKAETAMDDMADAFGGCEKVDTKDGDGTTWKFSIDFDRTAWARGADEQINLTASGSSTLNQIELPVSISMSVVRIENAVSILMFVDLAADLADAPRKLTNAASARLQAVVDGQDPGAPEPVLEGYPIGAAFADLLGLDEPA
jgi:hypothetical protein